MQFFYMRKWFTFFFIPVFPTSPKKFYIECSDCGNSYKPKKETVELLNQEFIPYTEKKS